jgi:hypothetical protein
MPEDEARFDLASLFPEETGLPFVVWIAETFDAPHDARVEVSQTARSELISVAIRPDVRVVGAGTLSAHDLALLRQWVELNRDVIIRYWDGDIESTREPLDALKAVESET